MNREGGSTVNHVPIRPVPGLRIPAGRIWLVLSVRSLFTFAQILLVALAYRLRGDRQALFHSSAWWLWFVTATNVVCLLMLRHYGRIEGFHPGDFYRFRRSGLKGDLLWTALSLTGIAVVGLLPGIILQRMLWGNSLDPNTVLFRTLPVAAVYPLFLLMPVTQALAELPLYWGYAAPRLRNSGLKPVMTILVVGFILSLQHMFFSFIWDWRFNLWLALKFFPFALWTGYVVWRRPTVLPYLVVIHFLMDASLPVLSYMVSVGIPFPG